MFEAPDAGYFIARGEGQMQQQQCALGTARNLGASAFECPICTPGTFCDTLGCTSCQVLFILSLWSNCIKLILCRSAQMSLLRQHRVQRDAKAPSTVPLATRCHKSRQRHQIESAPFVQRTPIQTVRMQHVYHVLQTRGLRLELRHALSMNLLVLQARLWTTP